MKKFTKIVSTFLAVLMMLGTFSILGVSAADDDFASRASQDPSIYITEKFNTPEDKFNSMTMSYVENGYEMRLDPISGEVAVKDLTTGQYLFTNPYDIGNSKANDESVTVENLLSQIIIKYLDEKDAEATMNSFADAVKKGQISASLIQNGFRVEYSIGEESSRLLTPFCLTEERYIEYILNPVTAAYEAGTITSRQYQFFTYGWSDKLDNYDDGDYYTRLSLSLIAPIDHEAYIKERPILAETDIWVLDPNATKAELKEIEEAIKKACPDYSFDMMDEDHAETGYVPAKLDNPLFKLALEYSLNKDGLSVRLPCNGLRYDVTKYKVEEIQVLPYIGTGHNNNDGYTFFPDGAGALFDFKELKTSGANFIQPMYGIDYAYHSIHEIRNQTPARYPVYGVIANERFYNYSYNYIDAKTNKTIHVEETVSNTITTEEAIRRLATNRKATDFQLTETGYTRGYVAIIEEGESLAKLATYHAGGESEYNTVLVSFNPRPKDSYKMSASATEQPFIVASPRKYTGSFKIQYKMLCDEATTANALAKDPSYVTYETSWFGMAEFYRDYLIAKGTLTQLTQDDVQADIPLYIEVFGALETQQTIMTLPVNVMTPLTTFENIKTMFDELSAQSVNNINFKMTGFANGGMYSTVPYKLKWEKAVGGEKGFEELVEIANAINSANDNLHMGLYPDFDFAYISQNTLFDHTNLKQDAVKTIDNRYTSKRVYSATQQKYMTFYQLAVSPSRYDKFYTELMDRYGKYDLSSISVASLGNALNSDFDEDDPYNREDSKNFTVQALNAIQNANNKQYSLMMDAANAYTWKYADHMLNMDLDSSLHNQAHAAVPFLGVVLHGYVQFAGMPLNEESNIGYALLKALENGAGMNFILSYQNYTYLKEDPTLSQNYSIRYDIWKDDVVKYYNQMNNLLKDVQTKVIINHKFVSAEAERVLDLSEIEKLVSSQLKDAIDRVNKEEEIFKQNQIENLADARLLVYNILNNKGDTAAVNEALVNMQEALVKLEGEYVKLQNEVNAFSVFFAEQVVIAEDETQRDAAVKAIGSKIKEIKGYAESAMKVSATVKEADYTISSNIEKLTKALVEAEGVVAENTELSTEMKAKYLAEIADAKTICEALKTQYEAIDQLTVYYDGKDASIDTIAVSILKDLKAPETSAAADAINKIIKSNSFEQDAIFNLGAFVPKTEDADDEQNTPAVGAGSASSSNVDKLAVNKNSVVEVTYGDRYVNAAGLYETTAYKTFLLNYNSYAVRLEYNNVLYTVPAGSYVVVYENR